MVQLEFDLFPDAVEPAWGPLFKPFTLTLLSVVTPDRCRDCGGKPGATCGSRPGVGVFYLCDDCAALDGCTGRVSSLGGHLSRWGIRHEVGAHDGLVDARERRRDVWRRVNGAV